MIAISTFFLLYVFVLVRPRKRDLNTEKLLVDYAHRGLHSETVPENSLEAFSLAVKNGYGIELDVQLSGDGEVMVFHDDTLERLTGVSGKFSDYTAKELHEMKLLSTNEHIPYLSEVLEAVDGKVPLLIELKGTNLNTSLCEKTAHVLNGYKGDYCIESFNPFLVRKMKKFLPNVFYGQLYSNLCQDAESYNPILLILSWMVLNFISRPDFIAYNQVHRNSFPVKITTTFYKAEKFVWTIRTEQEMTEAKSCGECLIFETKGIQ